jgi:hypothetical protein
MVPGADTDPVGHVHVNAGRLWAGGAATAVVAPFTQPAPLASKVFTAVINVIVGVAVISLLSGVGRGAVQPVDVRTRSL